jgi:hypothetical protein
MALDILIAGKYRLGRKLGGGSFGEIFLGTNLQTGEEVGIKLVRRRLLAGAFGPVLFFVCLTCFAESPSARLQGGNTKQLEQASPTSSSLPNAFVSSSPTNPRNQVLDPESTKNINTIRPRRHPPNNSGTQTPTVTCPRSP